VKAILHTYDLIFDIVGATTFDRCQNSLKPQGVFLQNIMGSRREMS
jgi:NADPH:quinone reductase-like Zn-dependent oxidoreductase